MSHENVEDPDVSMGCQVAASIQEVVREGWGDAPLTCALCSVVSDFEDALWPMRPAEGDTELNGFLRLQRRGWVVLVRATSAEAPQEVSCYCPKCYESISALPPPTEASAEAPIETPDVTSVPLIGGDWVRSRVHTRSMPVTGERAQLLDRMVEAKKLAEVFRQELPEETAARAKEDKGSKVADVSVEGHPEHPLRAGDVVVISSVPSTPRSIAGISLYNPLFIVNTFSVPPSVPEEKWEHFCGVQPQQAYIHDHRGARFFVRVEPRAGGAPAIFLSRDNWYFQVTKVRHAGPSWERELIKSKEHHAAEDTWAVHEGANMVLRCHECGNLSRVIASSQLQKMGVSHLKEAFERTGWTLQMDGPRTRCWCPLCRPNRADTQGN